MVFLNLLDGSAYVTIPSADYQECSTFRFKHKGCY